MAKRHEIKVLTGELAGRRFPVPDGGLRLGRSSTNDLQISDEGLSRNHCLFEISGETALRVIDLASANGTYVNGEAIGTDARELKAGDVIEAGGTRLEIVGDGPAAAGGAVDLGLGAAGAAPSAAPSGAKRSPLANILWAVAAAVVIAAIAVVLYAPGGDSAPTPPAEVPAAEEGLRSLRYEKVDADATRIFRYELTVDGGTLRVVYDDVPGENRHAEKSAKLSERAAKRIAEILRTDGWDALEPAYTGPGAASENALSRSVIRVVSGTSVRETVVENTAEPAAFKSVREALEAFANNELGIWATQYSKEQLLKLSAECAEAADAKWNDRDVEYGNVEAAVRAYREALVYLETVSPKPEGFATLGERLAAAEAELDARYRDQRFSAERAIKLGDWEAAAKELGVLCEIVSDKDDPRHAEASAKLVDVERRLAKAKKGGK